MPKRSSALTALAVKNLEKPGFHRVGGVPGLGLQVKQSGARSWILKATVDGRRPEIGLGPFPEVSLAQARDKARELREKIRQGIDPLEEARKARKTRIAAHEAAMAFVDAAEAYISAHEAGWRNAKHRQQWRNSLASYAYPVIGKMDVADIELPHVLKILEPIWLEKTETASRLRGRIESILDWAAVRGHRKGENPARWKGHLENVLPRPSKVKKPKHHRALAIDDAPAFMEQLRKADGMGSRALEFAILTAVRSNEARGATWDEIDVKKALWTVPGERMKAGREHRVPLSQAAIDLLSNLPRIAGTDLLFPSSVNGPLSDATLGATVKRLGADATAHGFRSTFRDWAAERTAYPHEVAEMALAHVIRNQAEAAYRRGDLLEKRWRMMNDWASFLADNTRTSDVIPLRMGNQK